MLYVPRFCVFLVKLAITKIAGYAVCVYDSNPDGCLASDLSQLTEARSRSGVLFGL